LTFDLEHLQRISCDVMKLCTKVNAIEQSAAELLRFQCWPSDLEQDIALRVALGSGISLTFDNLYVNELYRYLMLIRYVTLW